MVRFIPGYAAGALVTAIFLLDSSSTPAYNLPVKLSKRYLPKKARRKRKEIAAKLAARLQASKYPKTFQNNSLGSTFFVTGCVTGNFPFIPCSG